MKRGRREKYINVEKFIQLNKLYELGEITQKDACTILHITPHLYRKYVRQIKEDNEI